MPTPERTSRAEIVRAGCAILEADGPSGLTMQAVAARVGVRAPSLYKRVRNRDELLGLIIQDALDDLGGRLDAAAVGGGVDARTDLRELARITRAFAHERPAAYRMVFADVPEASRPGREALAQASAAVLAVATALAGSDDALPAARTVTAWVTGFIGMELAGAFRLGGDVDEAFDYGVRRLAEAIASA
ncbi:MAG: WHG domain-containing protein [Leifsonia sp.]